MSSERPLNHVNRPWRRCLCVAASALVLLCCIRPSAGYVESTYTLGRVVSEATQICLLQVERVDKDRNLILYRKVQDLKGTGPEKIKHNIGRGGLEAREWPTIMSWAEPGKQAVFFSNGGQSETCIDKYWYQAYAGDGGWWNMTHGEPYLLRSFAGPPSKLASAVTSVLAGQEVIIPCMIDGDKEALKRATARIQRLKASLKLMDYDPRRDFCGWGGEDFRPVADMPAFSHLATLMRTDPEAGPIASADLDQDGRLDLCLSGQGRTVLVQNGGSTLTELPVGGPARSAAFADYNGDGRPDLLLCGAKGPQLFANEGKFRLVEASRCVPREAYYDGACATWLDADADGAPDIVLANGHLGMRLYRNISRTIDERELGPPKWGPWHYVGPFENREGRGFATVYPPEREIRLDAVYPGKDGTSAAWHQAEFADGQVHNLCLFEEANNHEAVVYLHRTIDTPQPAEVAVSLGSDDTLTVWLNGDRLLSENVYRAASPDQARAILPLRKGRNDLLLKIAQGSGEWAFYFRVDEESTTVPLRFEDATEVAGLDSVAGRSAKARHLATCDVDGNGRVDLLSTAGGGRLWLNATAGLREAHKTGLTLPDPCGEPVFGDLDGDGRPDLAVPSSEGCQLYRNLGAGRFALVALPKESAARMPCASVTLANFTGQGRLDVILGRLHAPNGCLANEGGWRFRDAGAELGFDRRVFNTQGLRALDLNNDGALDLVLSNAGQPSCYLVGRLRSPMAAGAVRQPAR